MATVNGVKLDDSTYKVVKRMAEHGIGKGRAPRESVTIAEMCAALVHTGAFRRIAANKWAKEHPAKPAKKGTRKPKAKAAKKASPKSKPKKSVKQKAPKRARKPAAPKAAEAPAAAAPAAPAGDLLS